MKSSFSNQRKARKKKILNLAKGFYGKSKNCYQSAIDRVQKKLQYQYRDRRNLKRTMRSQVWIPRIKAALEQIGFKYSHFINKLNNNSVINFNRKSLAEIAIRNIDAFNSIAKQVMA